MNNISTFFRESSLSRFLIPAGIILIVFGIFTFISVDNSKDFIKVEAIVTKTELFEEAYTDVNDNHYDATYTVFVKYTVDGTEYEEEYGVFSGYKKGDKVTISYNPKNPKEIAQPSSIILPIILVLIGIGSLVGGTVSIVRTIKRHKTMKRQEKEWANAE